MKKLNFLLVPTFFVAASAAPALAELTCSYTDAEGTPYTTAPVSAGEYGLYHCETPYGREMYNFTINISTVDTNPDTGEPYPYYVVSIYNQHSTIHNLSISSPVNASVTGISFSNTAGGFFGGTFDISDLEVSPRTMIKYTNDTGTILAGTRFIGGNDICEFNLEFYNTKNTWQIGEGDINTETALITGANKFSISSETFELCFDSRETLEKTDFIYLATTKTFEYSGSLTLTVGGEPVSAEEFSAEFVTEGTDTKIKISKIPEPSAFGLLAGLLALTGAVSRRKRR